MEDAVRVLAKRAEDALNGLAETDPGAVPIAEAVLAELRLALRDLPAAGVILGPLAGRLQASLRRRSEADSVRWVGVIGGYLAVGHRPKLKRVQTLRQTGATHILTLLDESEGATEIGAAARQVGIDWLWFPLDSGTPPDEARLAAVRALYESLQSVLAAGGRVYVHCSAGIHRTGLITYGLLRFLGMSGTVAVATLRTLRTETEDGVGEARLAWGDQFGARVGD